MSARVSREELERVVAVVDDYIEREASAYYGDRRSACDQVNGIFAKVARNLGYPAVMVRGYVGQEDAAHTWARVGELQIDLAGQQFGRARVAVFTSDPEYNTERTELPGERTEIHPEDEAIIERATAALRDRRA